MKNYWQKNKCISHVKKLPIFMVYSIVTTIVYLLPYTKFTFPYIYMACLMLISLPIIMLKRYKWLAYGIILGAVSLFVLFLNLLNGNYSFIDATNEMLRNVRFFLPVLWASYSLHYSNNKQRKCVIALWAIVVAFIMFKTLNALSENMWVSRLLAEDKSLSSAKINAYRLQNVGGFEFSYMMGIVTLCLVWTALNVKKMWIKICGILLSILCFYYIIRTMYTTLLLLTVIGIILLIFLYIKNSIVKVVFIVTIIGLFLGLVPIWGYLSGVFGDSLLAEKFIQIQEVVAGADVNELGKRPQLIFHALKNWLHSPVWGGYGESSNAHSLIFTMLEQNGLIGLVSWVFVYQQSWKMVTLDLKKHGINANLFHICMCYVLGLSFLNPIGYVFEVTITAFYIVPLWLKSSESCSDIH